MSGEKKRYIAFAVIAAALYALNAPLSKLLLVNDAIGPTMMAALLYLGAGAGMAALGAVRRAVEGPSSERAFTRADAPYLVGMVALDIAAPILLMWGLTLTTSANTALLNNFEIVATTLVALAAFHEPVSRKLWAAIALITAASMILSFEDVSALTFNSGSLLVLGACVCWGFENNCTRQLSSGDALKVVVVKGFGSGAGSLAIALAAGEAPPGVRDVFAALALGFVAYGLSIFFYVRAQRGLGAAKTSAYYAIAPFVSVVFSLLLFREVPGPAFWLALAVMAAGTWLASTE